VTISAIIPAYRCAAYIGEAVESVRAQTLPAHEIVVVDDGSPDESAVIAERLGARCIRQRHAGIGAARNRGVREGRGELIAFLDGDDVWMPDKLERQAAALAADPELDGVLGYTEQFLSPDLSPAERARLVYETEPQPGGLPGSMLVRRSAFERAGLFDESLPVGEFVEWYARALDAGVRLEVRPGVVLRRRLHASNTMRDRRDDYTAYPRILKQALDRRRAGTS
jgi:glycosyltransferase involved in cell wall biosynthesis